MSRRRRDGDSSLELLLDTITNTFGGILFLAILVSLLLRSTSPSTVASSNSGQATSPEEIAALEVTLEGLQDEAAHLRGQRPSGQPDADGDPAGGAQATALSLLERLTRLREEGAALSLATVQAQREAAAAIRQTTEIAASAESVKSSHTTAVAENEKATAEATELARVKADLERSLKPNVIVQTAGMPTMRQSTKRQVCIYVRYGRLFMTHTWLHGQRQGPNPTFFTVSPGPPQTARPRPGSGIRIEQQTIDDEVTKMLADFPSRDWVVAVVVFEDSFEHFQLVKQALVQGGYEYAPIPLKEGGAVFDSGGSAEGQ